MTEITKDRDFKTDINIESQTINYIKNPEKFKEDLQIALIEGKATGRTVVKTIDNMINGDKSQDIGDAERRSLIEIKEAIVRVQTAPAMDIIAEKDLADKNIQARLGVEIEKFDPNDPTLSEKVKERIDELKAEGKEIVAFYDKKTKKIFINQNAKDEEVRASIAREYKIKEDLELGRGKANDKGQLRSTVAGEIAYDEIKDRLKKGDKNPISASKFDVAKMDKDSEVTSDRYFNKTRGNLEKIVEDLKYYGVGSLLNLARPFVISKKEKEIDDKIEAARKNREDRKESIDKEVIREEKNELDRQMEISKLKYQLFKMKDSPEKKLLENRLHNLIRESDTLEGFYKVVFSSNKNDKDIKEFLTTPKEREEYRQREINKLKYQIFNEKDPNEKIALESRMKYLIRESNQLDSFLENGKEFLHSAAKQAPEGALKGLAFSAASKVKMSGPLLFLLTSENLNSNEDAVLSDMRKKNIKDISPDEEKYIKDFPEYYEDENIASRINILKTKWNKTERNNDIANYYSNKGTDISRGLGSFVGDFGGMIAGGIAGEIAISKTTNTFRGNLNTSTNINNYKEFPNKVFINDGTPGGTTKAYQNITTYPDGSMSISQKNLTTGEISLQKINPLGQLIYEKSLIPTVAYNAENTSLVLYDKSKFLSVPVATNGTLVAPLTTNSTLATVPLLTDGANKVGQVQNNRVPYNPVLKSPVKYSNLTDSENKFLNDYMGKEIPGKIVSKYNDVNKYEYNATTNPGPLAEGKNPPINNFYGGMYNDASNESGMFVRIGDKTYPYGSWYTKVPKNSEVQARIDLAIKKWWVDSNGEIKIRGFEADKSILDTMYYIEFPEGIPKYKGPVGYQGGPFLGGLNQEQYFIPNSKNFGKVIKSYPIK